MDADWHVVIFHFAHATALALPRLAALNCVNAVEAPLRKWTIHHAGRQITRTAPWLGAMALAQWPTDDAHAWQSVKGCPGVITILGGWPPATVADREVQRFRYQISELEGLPTLTLPPPCAAGDVVTFSHLMFHRLRARCLWTASGVVGLRLVILGRDLTLQVPYAAIDSREDPRPPRGTGYLRMRYR